MISSTNEGFKAINPFLNKKEKLHFALLLANYIYFCTLYDCHIDIL